MPSPMGKLICNHVQEYVIFVNGKKTVSLSLNVDNVIKFIPMMQEPYELTKMVYDYSKLIGVDGYSIVYPHLK